MQRKLLIGISVLCFVLLVVSGCKKASFTPEQKQSQLEKEFTTDAKNYLKNKKPQQVIRIKAPVTGQGIASPVVISGEAAGFWFFQGSFLVTLYNQKGEVIGSNLVLMDPLLNEYKGDKMYPFTGTLVFDPPQEGSGRLVVQNGRPAEMNDYPVLEVSIEVSFDAQLQQTQDSSKKCVVTGCNKEICSDKETTSICTNVGAEKTCYARAKCEWQKNAYCGWTYTDAFYACMRQKKS